MFIAVILFLFLAMVPSLSSQFRYSFRNAAVRFMDSPGYRSHVLELPHIDPKPNEDEKSDLSKTGKRNILIVVLALGLGFSGIWTVPYVSRSKMRFVQPLRWVGAFLHALHSGQVGDYLAWFTLGIGVFWGYLSLRMR